MAEKHDPGGEQPTSNEGPHKNEEAFPGNHGHGPVGNRGPDHRIQNKNEEKMQRANEKKPGDPIEVAPDQLSVGAECFTQSFVVQHEGNLHRTKNQNERAHEKALQWQIIEHVGHIHEVSEQQRHTQNKHAHCDHNPGPTQDVAKSAHREFKESSFAKTQSFDPGETDCDQINLNINSDEVLENEGDGVDGGGDFEQMGCR